MEIKNEQGMNGLKLAIEEGRIVFFNNGRYKYVPSHTYQKIKNNKFDSERANKMHDLKIINRKSTWTQVDRKLSIIENYVEKGLKRIENGKLIFH